MTKDIPVSFEYKGKQYKGFLSPVNGQGKEVGTVFFLKIDQKYCGTFSLAEVSTPGQPRPPGPAHYPWRFTSQFGEFETQEIADYFASVVLAWYE